VTADLLVVADAVVAALVGHTFSAPYNTPLPATRMYIPAYTLQDVATLKVPVVPRGVTTTVASRGKMQELDFRIDVSVIQQVPDTSNATVDPLMALVQEINDFLLVTTLATGVGMVRPTSISIANEPHYDDDRLEAMSVFQSVLSVTWRGFR